MLCVLIWGHGSHAHVSVNVCVTVSVQVCVCVKVKDERVSGAVGCQAQAVLGCVTLCRGLTFLFLLSAW